MRDLQAFHASFYKYKDKETQDAFLLKCCHAEPTKRKRPKNQKHTEKNFNKNLLSTVNRRRSVHGYVKKPFCKFWA